MTEQEVIAWGKKYRLDLEHLSEKDMTALKAENPNKPLCALLPLIARYQYLYKLGSKLEDFSVKNRNDDAKDQDTRLINRSQGWQLHDQAIRIYADAAVTLQMIQHPTSAISLPGHFTFKAVNLGLIQISPFEGRMLDYDHTECFIFNDKKKPALHFEDFEKEEGYHPKQPKELRPLLFV
jgi:hypothetical protein